MQDLCPHSNLRINTRRTLPRNSILATKTGETIFKVCGPLGFTSRLPKLWLDVDMYPPPQVVAGRGSEKTAFVSEKKIWSCIFLCAFPGSRSGRRREASMAPGSRSSMLPSRTLVFNRACRERRRGSWPPAFMLHEWMVLLLVLESVTLHVLHKLICALVTGGGDYTASGSLFDGNHSTDQARPVLTE
jgi:hypothetical protein